MATTTLSSKGQIVIPKKIREDMGLKPGTNFQLKEADDGTLVLIPLKENVSSQLFGVCSDMELLTDLEEERRREKRRERDLE